MHKKHTFLFELNKSGAVRELYGKFSSSDQASYERINEIYDGSVGASDEAILLMRRE